MNNEYYKNKGYVGLCNLGNTCFLNASVQILNHTYELVEFIQTDKIRQISSTKNIPDTTIMNTWSELSTMMWGCEEEPCAISPKKFVYEVHQVARIKGRELFTGWGQNDMTEFLLFIVECIHNSICRSIDVVIRGNPSHKKDESAIKCYDMLKTVYSKEYSEVMELFYGIYMSEISSTDKLNIYSSKPEHFFMLDIPIPFISKVELSDCFDMFVASEPMYGDNAWFNEKTGKKENVQKNITFWSFPKILVIVLKRFSPDGTMKRNTMVHFPLDNLDLRKYVNGYSPEQYVYQLYGVCNHVGNVMGGHYTAFVRNRENRWLHYNDDSVREINEEDVVSPKAYCLFYRRH